MFVFLSKTLDLFLSPLTWGLLFAAVAVWRLRGDTLGVVAGVLGIAVIAIPSMPRVSGKVMRLAESSVRSTYDAKKQYDAVIVLGGSVDSTASLRAGHLEVNLAAERILQGFELMRTEKAENVVISGGMLEPIPGIPTEAELVGRQYAAWGIPKERIFEDRNSRNTYENAVETAKIVKARGWTKLLLVTSAAHMPRSLETFRAAGLTVDSYPVDWRAGVDAPGGDLVPRSHALSITTDAVREMVGRSVYRWKGYAR